MAKKPLIISCCLTPEQLISLEKNSMNYYLESVSACGPPLSLARIVAKSKEEDPSFMNLIARKRALTLKRIECMFCDVENSANHWCFYRKIHFKTWFFLDERQKQIEESREKKLEEAAMLREQYETAMLQNQIKLCMEIRKEIETLEENMSFENLREKLIQEEA